jgi:hypothetical protein
MSNRSLPLQVETEHKISANRRDLPIELLQHLDGIGESDARSATSSVYFRDTITEQLEGLEEEGQEDTPVAFCFRQILELSTANNDADFTIYD